jgi:hypothetical protein
MKAILGADFVIVSPELKDVNFDVPTEFPTSH